VSEGQANVLVRVWLPDRPGALGQVASRIGSVRGDIIGVDVLERSGGVAIDEFAVNLAHEDLIPMLVREIEEVDGASIEEVRVVGHFPDPRLDALQSAIRLCQTGSVAELHQSLSDQVCQEFLAEWVALIDWASEPEENETGSTDATGPPAVEADGAGTLLASTGDSAPEAELLVALAAGLAASPLVASGAAGPEDLAAAPLAGHGATLLVSRQGYAFRRRERGQLIALARIADRMWTLLDKEL
jgi:hypothetical protein